MDKLTIALIGAGTWGAAHAMLYSRDPRVQLAAICDLDYKRAADLATRTGVNENCVFTDYKAMLNTVNCSAVAIVTPDFAHREIAVHCAQAGKHMIIEKPIATTAEDALAIRDAIEKNNVRAMVDFHNRWNPPFASMAEDIKCGVIGQPYSAYCRLNDTKWVATHLLPWAAQSSILWFLGSHSVDTLRWTLGSEVKRVYSVSRSGLLRQLGVDTVDIYQTILEFENGCIATMENGWITPNSHPNVNDFKFNITGTDGMFSLDLSNHNMIQRFTDKITVPDVLVNNFVRDNPAGFAYQSVKHFIDCLISGEEFYVSIDDAVNVTFTVLAIMESARRREPVDVILPDALN